MIFGIYLAAGQSKRMGSPKLALSLGNKSLGSIALETALESALDKTIVVTSEKNTIKWIPSEFSEKPYRKKWIHIRCKESWMGQAASLKCGLLAAEFMKAEAIMILLADQPFVTTDNINQLVTLYKKEKPAYIASSFNGVKRPPVLFSTNMFSTLHQLHGDEGARKVIRGSTHGLTVSFTDERSFLDIDTAEQYQTLKTADWLSDMLE